MSVSDTNNVKKEKGVYKNQPVYMKLLSIEQIIFNLTHENLEISSVETIKLFDSNFQFTFNLIISNLIYSSFISQKKKPDLYFKYLKLVQTKEEMQKFNNKIIEVFERFLSNIKSHEAYYLITKMIEQNFICGDNNSKNFFIYNNPKNKKFEPPEHLFSAHYYKNYEKLKTNDWELHKKYIEESYNPDEMVKIIRNDEIEKLQEVSSQENFDFNQTIEPSIYERCSFVNGWNVTLIDYAAFFSSVKCFKYLLMNGAYVHNTGKYAVAGGNEEIIHLCEQNHSTFKDAYETAIMFHRNDIFKYIYENKLESINGYSKLGKICIQYYNYEIFTFLLEEGLEVDADIINKTAKIGNLFLIKHFLQKNQQPKDILVYSAGSGNIELFKYIMEQKELISMLEI